MSDALEQYQNEFDATDFLSDPPYDCYVTTFSNERRLVTVHLYKRGDDLLTFITKSRYVTVAQCQEVAEEAVRLYRKQNPFFRGSVEHHYDPTCLGQSRYF